MKDALVKVENVSKKFCRNLKKSLWYGLKDLGAELIDRSGRNTKELRPDEFWAVKSVSFELKRGECLGLIGKNGAGKTTLLRMLNGLIKPDQGRIEMHGKVGALIALGAGFNPILTGRENIYVNASVLGLSKKEADAKFEEIVEFAELSQFIDAPVQSYSSGMQVRLGFAVASALDPDVLLLDEVLAVGDTRFRAKCLQRIKHVRYNGGAILLVTHILEQVAHFCDRALLLDKGNLIIDSTPSATLNHYLLNIKEESTKIVTDRLKGEMLLKPMDEESREHFQYNSCETRWGDRAASITDICLLQNGTECASTLTPGLPTELMFSTLFHTEIEEPIYGLSIKAPEGGVIFNTNSRELLRTTRVPRQKKGDKVRVCFNFMPFLDAGKYLISIGIASEMPGGIQAHDRRYDCLTIQVVHPLSATGDIDMHPTFSMILDA